MSEFISFIHPLRMAALLLALIVLAGPAQAEYVRIIVDEVPSHERSAWALKSQGWNPVFASRWIRTSTAEHTPSVGGSRTTNA